MAKSCGLRVGPRHFELVVLDGNAKRHRVLAARVGELPRSEGDDPEGALHLAVAALKEAVRACDPPRENVGVAIDSGNAAFRTLRVPFADEEKIERVLKFEVESLLPQWSIDDVVVDFHVLEAAAEQSELLITAVQKSDVARAVALCEKAGIEPLEVELEATAMVNAAVQAGVCTVENAQILVHVSDVSTSVVVVDAAKAREMRAIHIGALSHESAPPPAAAESEAPAAEGDAAGAATGTWLDHVPDADERERRLEQTIKRIRRELGRTVSATRTAHPIEAIHVCGMELPGLAGSTIADLPVRALEVPLEGDLSELPAHRVAIAYGVALRQLGGGIMRPSLRREELRYTGAFERLELPLAVVCLLLVTLLGVWNIFLLHETKAIDGKLASWSKSTINFLVGDPRKGRPGRLTYPPKPVTDYVAQIDEDDRTRFEQLQRMRFLLSEEIRKLEKELGQDTEITQPQSALTALTLVLDVLEDQVTENGRPSLRKVQSTYLPGKSGKPDSVKVTFDIVFFAPDSTIASRNYERFVDDLKTKPWFVSSDPRPTESLDTGKGIFVQSLAILVDVSRAPMAPGGAAG